jgi:chromosome segregation protein
MSRSWPGRTRRGVELPAGLQPALNAVSDTDPAHPALGLLRESYIADDLGAFLEFWKANPAFGFLAVVTRKGDLVDRRGLIYGGHHSSKKSSNSIVQREIDMRETAKALADEQKAHDDQKTVIDALNARLGEAEQNLEQRRADVLTVTQTLAAAQAEQRNAGRAAEDAGNRLSRMEGDLGSLEHARNEAHARWEKAQAGLAEADAVSVQQREKIHATETRITEIRTERDVKRDTLGQARLELAERRQKVEVLDRGLGEMERRRIQLSELLAQRQMEIETWTVADGRVGKRIVGAARAGGADRGDVFRGPGASGGSAGRPRGHRARDQRTRIFAGERAAGGGCIAQPVEHA